MPRSVGWSRTVDLDLDLRIVDLHLHLDLAVAGLVTSLPIRTKSTRQILSGPYQDLVNSQLAGATTGNAALIPPPLRRGEMEMRRGYQ